jgi:hypothetical protein
VERLLNPSAAIAAAASTCSGRGMSTAAVNAALKAAGYGNPDASSKCTRKAIQKGYISLEGGLEKTAFTGSCDNCGVSLSCTLHELLDQTDYAGTDYEDGGEGGVLQCEECEAGFYVTGMCEGQMSQDSGKFHNHCTVCPGFGKCLVSLAAFVFSLVVTTDGSYCLFFSII